MFKVTPQVAALGAESAVYDCLVSDCVYRIVYVKEIECRVRISSVSRVGDRVTI